MLFHDRTDAGRQLASRLTHYSRRTDVIVLALPNGGVPIAFEVAETLAVPLDIFLVRKLGVPGQPELAMGAIASGGIVVLNDGVIRHLNVTTEEIEAVTRRERAELLRNEQYYRGTRAAIDPRGRIVIIVDDGLATGSSMRAAIAALRKQQPQQIVVAVPVASRITSTALRAEVDEIVCIATPMPFSAVGLWYRTFSQTSNDTVRELLERAARRISRHATA